MDTDEEEEEDQEQEDNETEHSDDVYSLYYKELSLHEIRKDLELCKKLWEQKNEYDIEMKYWEGVESRLLKSGIPKYELRPILRKINNVS